jgi:hypothetical protein
MEKGEEDSMSFKDKFKTSLTSGADHDQLLALVHEHQAHGGMSSKEAYAILHQVWLDLGFDDSNQPSALQDNLEYVLEKVWYECPAAEPPNK